MESEEAMPKNEKKLVDWHTHIWDSSLHTTDAAREERTRMGSGMDASPQGHREAMRDVDRFVIVGTQWGEIGHNIPNDFVADQVIASEGRAIGFASVHPMMKGAVQEIHRAHSELGLKGLKLSPTYQGFHPSSEKAWQCYEAAASLGLPLMLHLGASYATNSTLEYGNPILFDPVARAFPNMNIIIAHLGQPWMAETVMLMRKHSRVFADLSARFHRPWQLYNGLTLAVEYGVMHKVLFGSDYPISTPSAAIKDFRALSQMTKGTNLPSITEDLIDDVLFNRPVSLIWPEEGDRKDD